VAVARYSTAAARVQNSSSRSRVTKVYPPFSVRVIGPNVLLATASNPTSTSSAPSPRSSSPVGSLTVRAPSTAGVASTSSTRRYLSPTRLSPIPPRPWPSSGSRERSVDSMRTSSRGTTPRPSTPLASQARSSGVRAKSPESSSSAFPGSTVPVSSVSRGRPAHAGAASRAASSTAAVAHRRHRFRIAGLRGMEGGRPAPGPGPRSFASAYVRSGSSAFCFSSTS